MCRSMSHSVQIRRCIRAKGNAGINTIPFAPKQTKITSNWWPVHADCIVETTTTIEVRSISILPMANGSCRQCFRSFHISEVFKVVNINMCRTTVSPKCRNQMCTSYEFAPVCASNSPGAFKWFGNQCSLRLYNCIEGDGMCVCDTSSEVNLNEFN